MRDLWRAGLLSKVDYMIVHRHYMTKHLLEPLDIKYDVFCDYLWKHQAILFGPSLYTSMGHGTVKNMPIDIFCFEDQLEDIIQDFPIEGKTDTFNDSNIVQLKLPKHTVHFHFLSRGLVLEATGMCSIGDALAHQRGNTQYGRSYFDGRSLLLYGNQVEEFTFEGKAGIYDRLLDAALHGVIFYTSKIHPITADVFNKLAREMLDAVKKEAPAVKANMFFTYQHLTMLKVSFDGKNDSQHYKNAYEEIRKCLREIHVPALKTFTLIPEFRRATLQKCYEHLYAEMCGSPMIQELSVAESP